MATFPALPLWTDAYLADTTHLTYAESGLYLAILMHMWRCPGCRIPNDRAWLMRKFRLNPADLDNLLIPLLKEFCHGDGNWWSQKRLTKEWEYCRKQSVRAKARWAKEKDLCQHTFTASCPTPTPTLKKESLSPSTQQESDLAPDGASNGESRYAFEGTVIKLIGRDFKRWKTAYPNIDLVAELTALDDYYVANLKPTERKNWFARCSQALANRHEHASAKKPEADWGIYR